jgi:putative transport protein
VVTVDTLRVLVSKSRPAVVPLGELELDRRLNAQVTSVRRADVDIVPTEEFCLQRGDRLRVVATVVRLADVSAHFGAPS